MNFEQSVIQELLNVSIDNVRKEIIAIIKIIYKDKEKLDEDVKLSIKKLRCIDEKDLRDLLFFGQTDERILVEIFNKIIKFDENYSKEDYENCIFYETGQKFKDMLQTNNMTYNELFVFANYNYAKKLVSKEKIEINERNNKKI